MSKRLKTVFKNRHEVAHMWATQSQEQGRTPGKGNIYFSGSSIWSFGSHFEIARFVVEPLSGEKVVLFTTRNYSSITGQHKAAVHTAIRHIKTYDVPDLNDLEGSARELAAGLENRCLSLFSSTLPLEDQPRRFVASSTKINAFISAFNLKEPVVIIPKELLKIMYEHIGYRAKRDKELNTPVMIAKRELVSAKMAEAKAKKEREELVDNLKAWRGGGPNTGLYRLSPQAIRINGSYIETSGGARVPLKECYCLLRAMQEGTAKLGTKIGAYTLTSYNDITVKIGCHTILINEATQVLKVA